MRATQLRVEIVRQGLSGYDLNRKLGLSGGSGYMNQVARGERNIGTALAMKIAQTLRVPMLEIFDKEEGQRWRAMAARQRDGVPRPSNSK